MANWPTDLDRERILADAIAQAGAAGWRLMSRTTTSAELTSPDGTQALTLQVDANGQVQHQQRSGTTQATPRGDMGHLIGPITSAGLVVWVLGVIGISVFLANINRPGLELVTWTKGCFWLLVGLLIYVAARLAIWKG